METKSIFKSKTFWLNIIAGLLAIIVYFDPEFIKTFIPDEHIQLKVLKVIGLVTAILNIILRSITNSGVTINKKLDI